MFRQVILFSISIVFLQSCSKRITYKPDYEDKIVVNASISPQRGVEVKLSKSISPAETQYYTVEDLKLENATVELYRSDTLLAVLSEVEKGTYKAANNLNIKADEEFYLKIFIESLPDVTTKKIIIPKTLTSTNYTFEQFDESNGEIIVWFQNNEFTPFFAIELWGEDVNNDRLWFSYYFPDFNEGNTCDVLWESTTSVLNTSCFNNDLVSIRIGLRDINNAHLLNEMGRSPTKKIKLKLKNVNEPFFRYAQTYDIETGFFESVSADLQITYSNIEGGYGIFVAENVVAYEFEL
jgi:hypothetical protein